jgi:hypothetical protein
LIFLDRFKKAAENPRGIRRMSSLYSDIAARIVAGAGGMMSTNAERPKLHDFKGRPPESDKRMAVDTDWALAIQDAVDRGLEASGPSGKVFLGSLRQMRKRNAEVLNERNEDQQ